MKFDNFRLKGVLITLLLLLPTLLSTLPQNNKNRIMNHSSIKYENNNFLESAQEQNLNDETFDYSKLFVYIGNKSFFCIILLYFQYSPYILFIGCFGVNAMVSYYYNFISWKIFDVLPEEVFQIVGMTVYLLIAVSIIYNLMFYEDELLMRDKVKTKRKQNEVDFINRIKKFSLKDVESLLRIIGIILISVHDDSPFPLKNTLSIGKLTCFSIDILANLISTLVAMLCGFSLSVKFSINCNLFFASITFLIMGVDIAIKFFSRAIEI